MALTQEERQIAIDIRDSGGTAQEAKVAIAKHRARQVQLEGTFRRETARDIKEIGTGIGARLEERIEKTGDIAQAQKEGLQGVLRSTFQRIGQGAGFVGDVVGEVVKGGVKAVLPQSGEEALKRQVSKIGEIPAVQNMFARFEELKKTDPAKARDIDAALGLGTLALDVGLAPVSSAALRGARQAVGAATRPVGRALAATGEKAASLSADIQGIVTGTGGETLRRAFMAGLKGGEDLSEFTKSLRGQLTPEGLVQNVRDSVVQVSTRKSQDFSKMIADIGGESVNTKGLKEQMERTLREFGIDVFQGDLDFAASKFSTVRPAQTKLQIMYDEIVKLPETISLRRLDTTRQALRNLKLAGDDNSARTANAIINDSIDKVRNVGKQVDGYENALKRFSEDADFLDELEISLSTGNKKSVDTAFRRLTTSLKTNNEQRKRLLEQLDEATGGTLIGQVAGQQLSETLPRGIIRQILLAFAGVSVASGQVAAAPGVITSLLLVSPRVAGEFARALGITGRKLTVFLESLQSAGATLKKLGIDIEKGLKVPPASAIRQEVEETQ